MSDPRIAHRRLVEHALANVRQVPLAMLLELLAPVQRLRDLAREFGLSPKGGFRLDKAPARVLAPMLADLADGDRLERVVALLFPAKAEPPPVSGAPESAAEGDESPPVTEASPPAPARSERAPVDPLRELREAELVRMREELERARESGVRGLERESVLRRQLQANDDELRQLRGHVQRVRPVAEPVRTEPDRDLTTRLHELEQEITAREAADVALRRQLAADKSRLRDLEEEVAELEGLLPKGRRRRRVEEPPPPPSDRRFLVPTFTPSFYRSLDGKDRTAIERAFAAAWLLCTEGHAYPGLEVKMMGGQDTWSLRASLGLRVYFRNREDGGVEFLEVADREEQHTTLRRLKDR
ncbi:MAG: hypothetical protein IPK26_23455 [Planctomycetes bacterium]|nr:hypothetical protein [Planctomycetota bacterium]